ncbi:hypothetical protein LAD77_00180 [Klebsiella pneumoniae]|nr:hypothetical protein [Klebsiella pneumoniae]
MANRESSSPPINRRSQRGEKHHLRLARVSTAEDKLNIWILDNVGRKAFRQFAKDAWVPLLSPGTSHEHAKAGTSIMR